MSKSILCDQKPHHLQDNSGKGLNLCMGDTDGLKFYKQDMSPFTKEEIKDLILEINKKLPKLVQLEDDGYFENILIIKTKNYVTNDGEKIKIKGSGLKDQKKEPAMLELIKEVIHSALFGINYDELQEIYMKYVTEAVNVKDIRRWCVKKTVSKKVLACKDDPTIRANEMKIWEAIKDTDFQEGDKVYLYDAIVGEKQKIKKGELQFYSDGRPKMEPDQILKRAEEYNNDTIDSKLAQRCFKTISIFDTILDMSYFKNYSLGRNLKELEVLKK